MRAAPVMRTACGFGDMDDPAHRALCLTCKAAHARDLRQGQTSLWTAFKIAVALQLVGAERAVRYSDRLAAKGR